MVKDKRSKGKKEERLLSLQDAAQVSQEGLAKLKKNSTGEYVDIVGYFENEIKKQAKEIEAQKEQLQKQEERIERDRINLIEVLGVFVALFTFISINVQIFSKLQDLRTAIWFMIIMGGIIITILLVIEIIVDSRFEKKEQKKVTFGKSILQFFSNKTTILFLLGIIEIVIGLLFTYRYPVRLNITDESNIKIEANIKSDETSNIELKSNSQLGIQGEISNVKE